MQGAKVCEPNIEDAYMLYLHSSGVREILGEIGGEVVMLLQEIKKIVKSIPYLIFVAAIIIGLFSQRVVPFWRRFIAGTSAGQQLWI